MAFRLHCYVATCVLFSTFALAPAQAQIAMLSIRSVESLRKHAAIVRPVLADFGLTQDFDRLLGAGTNAGMLAGVDLRRPLGAFCHWPTKASVNEWRDFPIVVYVPIADEKEALARLGKLYAAPKKIDDRLFHITGADKKEFFFCFAHRYAYMAFDKAALKEAPPDPAAFATPKLLTLVIHCERLPKDYRRQFESVLGPFTEELAEVFGSFFQQLPVDDAQGKQYKAIGETMKKEMPRLYKEMFFGPIEQTRQVHFDVDVDDPHTRVTTELVVLPKEKTPLAELAGYVGRARSKFQPLLAQAGFGGTLHLPYPDWLRTENIDELVATMIMQYIEHGQRDTLVELLKIFWTNVSHDGLDVCFRVQPERAGDSQFVVGMRLQQGRRLDHFLRDAYRTFPTARKKAWPVRFNQDRYAQARLHQWQTSGQTEEHWLAIRDDVLFFGSGPNILRAVKKALDDLRPTLSADSALLELRVSGEYFTDGNRLSNDLKKEWQKINSVERSKYDAILRISGGNVLRIWASSHPQFVPFVMALAE